MAANVARNLNTHYGKLAQSTQRLSTGLRVNSAADDAAGLAIRELQRADIAALHQGARNANDAVSMIQTADAALAVIDEKLIRMKELAEQAATGTYDSTQRLMIDSEFQAMAAEIDRIANATDFNGIHLLNGNLAGTHNGSGLNSTGAMKIHFGSGNDSAEDYYYVNIDSATLVGLGLASPIVEIQDDKPPVHIETLADLIKSKGGIDRISMDSGIKAMSYIPKGSRNINITIDGYQGAEDDLQIFTRDGFHLSGTKITNDSDNDYTWYANNVRNINDANNIVIKEEHGFNSGATYQIPNSSTSITSSFNDGDIGSKTVSTWSLTSLHPVTYSKSSWSGNMTFKYSGDFDRVETASGGQNNGSTVNGAPESKESLHIDVAQEDLLIIVSGTGNFELEAHWDYMAEGNKNLDEGVASISGQIVDNIQTQERAQQMLDKIDKAIERKDKIRAHLGALQNRLENTITNITTQAENLQAAESRISDVDVATEMTEFVRQQILTQSAVAMLSQANSMPQMAMQIIGG